MMLVQIIVILCLASCQSIFSNADKLYPSADEFPIITVDSKCTGNYTQRLTFSPTDVGSPIIVILCRYRTAPANGSCGIEAASKKAFKGSGRGLRVGEENAWGFGLILQFAGEWQDRWQKSFILRELCFEVRGAIWIHVSPTPFEGNEFADYRFTPNYNKWTKICTSLPELPLKGFTFSTTRRSPTVVAIRNAVVNLCLKSDEE